MRSLNHFRKIFQSKSELVLRSLPCFKDHINFEKSFKNIIDVKSDKHLTFGRDLFDFPLSQFDRFPKSAIETLLKSSYQTLKEKNKLGLKDYNMILNSYKMHNFNISDILNDMKTSDLSPNFETYSNLIEIHYRRGDMESVLNLYNIINEKYQLNTKLKQLMYCVYIRTGRDSEAEQYLKDENLYAEDSRLLFLKAIAYADIKKFSEAMKIVKEFPDDKFSSKDSKLYVIYWRLAKAGASNSVLNEILAMGNISNNRPVLSKLIYNLNREGLYIHSLEIFNRFQQIFYDLNTFNNIILSYNKRDCPINIYKSILENYANRISYEQTCLFSNMDYDSAYDVTVDIIKKQQTYCLVPSLLDNSFQGYNSQKIHQILNLGLQCDLPRQNRFLIGCVFIPGLFDYGIVKNYQEVLQIIPELNETILPSLFMYLLSNADFASFESLRLEYPDSHFEFYSTFDYHSKTFLMKSSLRELNKLDEAASKIFHRIFVNKLKGDIIIEAMTQLSYIDDIAGIKEAVAIARNLNVTFSSKTIEFVKRRIPKYGELLREFESINTTNTSDNTEDMFS